MGPNPMPGILIRSGKFRYRDEREDTCDDRGSDGSDTSTTHAMPGIAGTPPKLGEGHGTDFPSEPLRRPQPC